MPGNEAWNRNVFIRNVDRRGRYHVVGQAVPDGGSGDREGPAADGRVSRTVPADDWSEQSGGNADQADRRHEPVTQV